MAHPSVRRCRNCREPLKATARSDARFCSRACKATYRRRLRHRDEAFAIGVAVILGQEDEHVVRCPVCGTRFALGHGHRQDAVYDRPACRQKAYRARCAERVREAVTNPAPTPSPTVRVTDPGSPSGLLASENAPAKMTVDTLTGWPATPRRDSQVVPLLG